MKAIMMLLTVFTMMMNPVSATEEPKQPETIGGCIELINTEFGLYYLSPDKVYSDEMILQYDYCIGLAYEGYIEDAFNECKGFTNITPDIREEFQGRLDEAFVECEDMVDKTAILHFIFFQ